MVRNARWKCHCRHAVGRAVRFAGRAGIVRYAHCPVCGTMTRQVLERTSPDRHESVPVGAGRRHPVVA